MLLASEDIKQKQKVSVPCAEKCWSTPTPPSLHAEKCVALPLVIKRPVLQSVGTHVLVIKRPVLQSAGAHV